MNNDKSIPLDRAAKQAQTTTLNLLMHVKKGLLPADEHGGQWFVSSTDLNSFINESRRAEPGELCARNTCGKGCGSCSEE